MTNPARHNAAIDHSLHGQIRTTPARTDLRNAARAEALFASDASTSAPLSREQAVAAIRWSVRTHGGVRGCAAEMAAAYGEHPETAAPRMRWARAVVESLFTGSPGR